MSIFGLCSTCFFVSATSSCLASQSVRTTEIWRNQHSPAAKPAAGIYNEVADGPCLIVEIKLMLQYPSSPSVARITKSFKRLFVNIASALHDSG